MRGRNYSALIVGTEGEMLCSISSRQLGIAGSIAFCDQKQSNHDAEKCKL
jgi:hypothetical protein